MRKIREAAKILLEELEAGYLEVCKVPSRHGGYIRVPVSVNAEWYRRLCTRHQSARRKRRTCRRPRTVIRRCDTISALRRIMRGDFRGVYAERIKPFVKEMIERMAG